MCFSFLQMCLYFIEKLKNIINCDNKVFSENEKKNQHTIINYYLTKLKIKNILIYYKFI